MKALANYGPTATLFTLGPHRTIQQYDLSPPALVKNVRCDPTFSSPPSTSSHSTPKLTQHSIPGAGGATPVYRGDGGGNSGRGAATLSTIQRAADEMQAVEHARQLRAEMASPVSSTSRTESISSISSAGPAYRNHAPSVSSRATSGTTFSAFSPSMVARESVSGIGSPFYTRTASVASSGRRSRGSRLRNEVIRSPDHQLVDLFPHARLRLSTLPYNPRPQAIDQAKASAAELRRQMLLVVFGWEDDIEPMIRDELSHHQAGSMSATLLSKWLGEVPVDTLSAVMGGDPISSTDWMLLALSSMNGQVSSNKPLGRSFVQKLLQQGDIHTAVTILLSMGDRDDAAEIYTARNFYMEAILLTTLLFPDDWQRQAGLVRRWGEFVVENSQQHLAIRCFSCTGTDTSMPWASPTQSPFTGVQSPPNMLPQVISPPTSPPPKDKPTIHPGRVTTKSASLKLITSFGGDAAQFRFPGLTSNDRTPTNAPGITPIAESALSPGGTPSTYLRPQMHTAKKSLTVRTPGGFARHRLPSIGETPVDSVPPPLYPTRREGWQTPNTSGSEVGGYSRSERSGYSYTETARGESDIKRQEVMAQTPSDSDAPLTLSSARYDPSEEETPKRAPQTAIPSSAIKTALPIDTALERFAAMKEGSRARNGSRDRKPDGLHIQMPTRDQIGLHMVTATSDPRSATSSHHRQSNPWTTLHSNGSLSSSRLDSRSETRSPPVTSQSWASSAKSPSVSGRSMDQYISSLEEANFHAGVKKEAKEQRRAHRSRDGRSAAGESKHRSRNRHRDPSAEDRGRNGSKPIRPGKRSPSSPVPMSPDDLQKYRDANTGSIDSSLAGASARRDSSPDAPSSWSRRGPSSRRKAVSKNRSQSKTSNYSLQTVRRASPSGFTDSQMGSDFRYDTRSMASSMASSRKPSPDGMPSPDGRGRSHSKNSGSQVRSPSSPLPMSMSPQSRHYQRSDDDDGSLRLVEANRHRLRSAQRSTSRHPRERGTSARRGVSPDRRRMPEDNQQQQYPHHTYTAKSPETSPRFDSATDVKFSDGTSDSNSNSGRLHRSQSKRTLKKALAARELEARRESLTQRAMVPPIPHPATLSAAAGSSRPALAVRSVTDLSDTPSSTSWTRVASPPHQAGLSDAPTGHDPEFRSASVGPSPYGLPATPRAMRHPKYPSGKEISEIPEVPEVPDNFYYHTDRPIPELPRSSSAPIPEPNVPIPSDMPAHPAFHRGLRPSAKRPNFSPLGDIGKQRRTPSVDHGVASIGETLHQADSPPSVTVLPHIDHPKPPILPELQHLAMPPPPPPPPPPAPGFHHDGSHHSMSSGSGVGTINIVMDDSRSGTPVIDVPAHHGAHHDPVALPPPTLSPPVLSPPMVSPPTQNGGFMVAGSGVDWAGGKAHSHSRGRSIEHLNDKVKGITDRMRSTSRSRAVAKSPRPAMPSPYESLPEYF